MDDHVLDDIAAGGPGLAWRAITDGVMGGLSDAALRREPVAGRDALRLTGTVRLENNGGFIQMARDFDPAGGVLDASGWAGLVLDLHGDGGRYGVHLRPDGLLRPWQSWRAGMTLPAAWTRVRLPFDVFAPHRIEGSLPLARLRRIGLVAIGAPGPADIALARLALYR